MEMERGYKCPFSGFEKCKGYDCALFVHLRGTHPQTGAEMDERNCALSWLPLLLVENAKEVREGVAATQSLRNEMARASGAQVTGIGELVRLANEGRAQREADAHTQAVAREVLRAIEDDAARHGPHFQRLRRLAGDATSVPLDGEG